MSRRNAPQGIVLPDARYASIDMRKPREARILRAYGIGRELLASSDKPRLFSDLEVGMAFVVKEDDVCFVCCKLNGHNAGGGDNSVVIGGKYRLFGGWWDFAKSGSVIVGVRGSSVVFPIPGKAFDARERRSLRHA